MYLSYVMWLLILAAAVTVPEFGETLFAQAEVGWIRMARHTTACWIFVGFLALTMRALLLPLEPIPKPVIYDEFSYLLGADTFASGRATNPAPAIGSAFESPYVLVRPTYASKYPPGQALVMAIGQRAFGHPWFGVWMSAGAMCAAICWALQAWVPPHWALLGGVLTLPLGVFTYWMDSYWGGALAGAAGAMVLGAYGRIASRDEVRWAWLVGLGLLILANTRMLEGAVVGTVTGVALLRRPGALARVASMLAMGAVLMGWYNWRVTGDALRMPYMEYERQYAIAPFFSFLPIGETHFFANPVMEDLHRNWDVRAWRAARSGAILLERPGDWWRTGRTLFGNTIFIVVVLGFLPVLIRKRELRVPILWVALGLGVSFVEISYFDHYAGPVVAAAFLMLVSALRELRGVEFQGRPAGRFLSRAVPLGALVLLVRVEVPVLYRHEPFESTHPSNARRERLETLLAAMPGRQLVVVRYTGQQSPHEEWVYNRADLNRAAVVWAHDLGDLENKRLLALFADRHAWLFEPDTNTEQFTPLRFDRIASPGADANER